jgi:amino acid permease
MYYTEQMLDPSLPGWVAAILFVGIGFTLVSLGALMACEWKTFLVAGFVTALMFLIVWHGPREVYLNEPVTATKVKYHDQMERVSRSTSTMVGYVTYQVPEGEVSFRMGQGYVYHDNVILYKQVKK